MLKSLRFSLAMCLGIISLCSISFTYAAEKNIVGINNISHTINNKTVNLKWDVTDGNNQADLFLWTPDAQVFNFISTIDVYAKQASFQIKSNGNHVVRFIPTGGGNDIRYSFNITGVNHQEKDITVVPKTGATSNILLILAISVLLYVLYWYRKEITR